MTGDDLKRMQDTFFEGAKQILIAQHKLRPVGFIVTMHKHVDRLFESGWGVEFIDPKECLRDVHEDGIAVLIVDLLMDWKRLYHAVMTVFPQAREVLPQLLALGRSIEVDDPYMRVMRPFMTHVKLDEKAVIAATMRHICEKTAAFASVFQSEAWQRTGPFADGEEIPDSLEHDMKAVEVVISSMETHDFARMLTVPIQRERSTEKCDDGKIVGFGERIEGVDAFDNTNVLDGRFTRFLKPLGVAS